MLDVLFNINKVLMTIVSIVFFNQIFHLVMSFFIPKTKYKEAKNNHKYAYLICARNEEEVIGNLIDSIYKQDYPKDLMKVFVVCDNCNDNTYDVCVKHGAIAYKRFDKVNVGKCYALDYGINKILNEYNDEFEALFIFDADNLLSKNFTFEMNKAYDKGCKIITGYRASKNFDDSWISASSSMAYLREFRQIHRVRSFFKIGTYVSGTGFLVSFDILKKDNGWKYNTLVEDIEFSFVKAMNNEKIYYCEDAVFYDEQPTKVKESWNQRIRWCKGIHQIFFRYNFKMIKSMIAKPKLSKWGMFVHTNPLPAICLLWTFIYLILGAISYFINPCSFQLFYNLCLKEAINNIIIPILISFGVGLIIMLQNYKKINCKWYKKIYYIFTFPIFMAMYLPMTLIALFKKVKWKQIKHTKKITVDEV